MKDLAFIKVNDYKNICDKVREKTGSTENLKAEEIPAKIDEVYAGGKTDGNREMWDNLTANNTRMDIGLLFAQSKFDYIRPPYKLVPTAEGTLNQTFFKAKKLKKIESAYFDFSNKKRGTFASVALHYTFNSCTSLEEIEDIGLQPDFTLANTFSWSGIKKIACIRVDENMKYDAAFTGCPKLEEVTFEGVIGQNGLSFADSPLLTKESLLNIIGCLKDYSTDTSGTSHTVTLGQTNLDKLTSDEKAIATQKGWSLL